jgi:ABC-type transport system involved in multi-copper enzyme maturation permease subunit
MNNIFVIALNTCREAIRSKVLYLLFFFAVILILLSLFFGSVTIGDRNKVVTSFSLFAISIFSVLYAVISGVIFLNKELSKKTIYNILAKPVSRLEFLLGKYFGLLFTTILIVILMSIATSLFLWLLEGNLNFYIYQASASIIFELILICAFAIFFSSIVVTPILSGAFTFGVFLAGRSSSYILNLISSPDVIEGLKPVLNSVYQLIPHLDWINLNDETVYQISASYQHISYSFMYSIGYAGILLILASYIFTRREFN